MKVVFAALLLLVGVMILLDTFLRAVVQGVRGDQVPTLVSGVLCLMAGSYVWRTRPPAVDPQPQPVGSTTPPTDAQDPLPAPQDGDPGHSPPQGEARATHHDPFAAYNAGSNVEAHLVCGLLQDAGIQAVVIEDVSQVGVWLGGTVAELHKPQVWIERADTDRAGAVLAEYERRSAERRAAVQGERAAGPPVGLVREECGRRSEFPAAQRGTTQSCPHCRAYVDVGDEVGLEGWDEAAGEREA